MGLIWIVLGRLAVVSSASAATANHRSGSLREDLDIEPQRPSAGIPDVEPHHFIECDAASPFHLPQTRNPWLHRQQAPAMPKAVPLDFIRNRRSRADERHLASQNV